MQSKKLADVHTWFFQQAENNFDANQASLSHAVRKNEIFYINFSSMKSAI